MRSRNAPRSLPAQRRRRRRLASGALAGTLVLAACGGGDDPASGSDAAVELPDADADTGDDAASGQVSDDAGVDAATEPENEVADAPEAEAEPDVATEADVATGPDAATEAAPAQASDGRVDLVGADVLDSSEIPTNLLPDVVLDDLTNDRKVNFRNLVPQDKPILLWMYAPH